MDCGCGWSRATNMSNMNWAGHNTRYKATRPSDGIGNSSAAPSRFAGIMPHTQPRTQRKKLESHLSHKFPCRAVFRLKPREQGKKISERKGMRPQVSWPMALRAVRGWLEPWIMLRRYWNGWSPLPPPPALQLLLTWLERDSLKLSTTQLDLCQQTTDRPWPCA
jgi:hypothetical protein